MTFIEDKDSPEVVAAAEKVWGLAAKRKPGRPPKKLTDTEKELNLVMCKNKPERLPTRDEAPAPFLEKPPVTPTPTEEAQVSVFPIKCRTPGCTVVAHNSEEAAKLFTRDCYSPTGFRKQCRTCKRLRAAELKPPRRVLLTPTTITLDFSTLPDDQGKIMFDQITAIAQKQYRSPAQQIFFMIKRYLDQLDGRNE